MKKLVALVLILLMLMSGCAKKDDSELTPPDLPGIEYNAESDISSNDKDQPSGGDGETSNAADDPSDSTDPEQPSDNCHEENTQPVEDPILFENAQEISENALYISNSEIESMASPDMYMLGNSLLLCTSSPGGSGYVTKLALFSLANGKKLHETEFKSNDVVSVQVRNGKVGICDLWGGKVYVLDNTLAAVGEYNIGKHGENWFLNPAMDTVYTVHWTEGIFAVDLKTGSKSAVLTNVAEMYVRNYYENNVTISYIDLSTLRNSCINLNLKTGQPEQLPVEYDVIYAVKSDDIWTISKDDRWGQFTVMTESGDTTFEWKENRLSFFPETNHLVALDENARSLYAFDINGNPISACSLPAGNTSYIGHDVLWSEFWEGYFFLDFDGGSGGKLMFWDTSIPASVRDLPKVEDSSPVYDAVSQDLYDRSAQISETYGVEVLIADQCDLEYNSFTAYAVTDEYFINIALDCLENALAAYPEGFLRQLPYGTISTVRFEFIGGLQPKDSSVYSDSYGGFASKEHDFYRIVFDTFMMTETKVYHELSHVIDKRLAWDASLRSDALFSEESWLALQPEGFEYAETYSTPPAHLAQYIASGYFVDEYSCRYATEDRATMMERAMISDHIVFEINPHLIDKLEFYSDCIRDCFNTDGWPEVTAWEALLP